MALLFEKTSQRDLLRIRALFEEAFRVDDLKDRPSLMDARMMDWKYWTLRPGWDGARGYALTSEAGMQAHAAVLPLTYEGAAAAFSAHHFIDWAASTASISGGAKLLRRLSEISDVTLAIGGSQTTRRLLPMLQFRPIGTVLTMARPIRPWLQVRTHQYRDWRLPARLARNAWWSRAISIQAPPGWSQRNVVPECVPDAVWAAAGEPGTLWRRRGPDIAAYFLSCPLVRFELFLVCEDSIPSGGFMLAIVNRVARIADLWLTNPSGDRYERVYRLAVAAAYENGQVAELAAYSSIPSRTAALERCGFQSRAETKLMVFSRTELPLQAFDCQMLDNDAAFMHGRSPVYLT